jgi:glycogen debranching enzyme
VEPHAHNSINHLTILRGREVSVLSLPAGDIDADTDPATGVYFRDARHLSRFRVQIDGCTPLVLDTFEDGDSLSATLTNPHIDLPDGTIMAPGALLLRRRRVVSGPVAESLALSNYGPQAASVDIVYEFDADFEDIFVVRGHAREAPEVPVEASAGPDQVSYGYMGLDGIRRQTRLLFRPAPTVLTEHQAVFSFVIDRRETRTIEIGVRVDGREAAVRTQSASASLQRRQAGWLDTLTSIETDDPRLDLVLQRSLLDIEALSARQGGNSFVAAGVPWFDALFGRDSLLTGIEMLAFSPEVLRNALLILARNQSRTTDPGRDAEPGKIPHEIRRGELAGIGEVPFGVYYGSVDATPLFIISAIQYYRWTHDRATIASLWPSLVAAMDWCRRNAAANPDGLLTYSRVSEGGLEHQGWKDSWDAIAWPDGRLADPPIALIEVQAYLYAAYIAFAELAGLVGREPAFDTTEAASCLHRTLHQRMADPALGYVLCIDGEGRPVPTPASNAGHVLWAEAATSEAAAITGDRLFETELFTGWGIRTLSADVASYNPLGYHVGTVWPHDNAIVLAGLRRYGLDDHAWQLGKAIVDAALLFPGRRIPELFSGDARALRSIPTPYPVASRPQAWSAASLPYVLTSLLGIKPGRDGSLLIQRPLLPTGVDFAHVRNLRCAGMVADLTFRRQANHVSVEVDRMEGVGRIALAT